MVKDETELPPDDKRGAAPTSDAAKDTEARPRPASGSDGSWKWVTASIGVPAVLYAIGYVADYGQQDLLGVPLTTAAPTAYLLSAGRMFLDLMTALQNQWIPLAVLALVICAIAAGLGAVAGAFLRRLGNPRVVLTGGVWWGTVAASFIVLHLLVTAEFVRPALVLRNVLYRVSRVEDLSPQMQDVICMRVIVPGCSRAQASHQRAVDLRFTAHVFLVIILGTASVSLATGRLRRADAGRRRSSSVVLAFGGALLVLTVVNALAVPYTYGKTVRSTPVKEVIVVYEDPEGDMTYPHGLMLSETADEISFFHKERRLIFQVPRKAIKLIVVEQIIDFLSVHISNSVGSKEATPPK